MARSKNKKRKQGGAGSGPSKRRSRSAPAKQGAKPAQPRDDAPAAGDGAARRASADAPSNAPPAGPSHTPRTAAPHAGLACPTPMPDPQCESNIIGVHLWQIRWIRDLAMIVAVVLLVWLAYSIRAVLSPVLIALGLAYVFNPLVDWIEQRWGIRRMGTTLSLIVLAVGAVIIAAALILPPVIEQSVQLRQNFPRYREELMRRLDIDWTGAAAPAPVPANRAADADGDDDADDVPDIADANDPAAADDAGPSVPPPAADEAPAAADVPPSTRGPPAVPANTPGIANDPAAADPGLMSASLATEDLKAFASFMIGTVNVGGQVVGRTFGLTTYFIFAFFLILVCFFFFSWRFKQVLLWFDQFIPARRRDRVMSIVQRMDNSIAAYVRGRLIQSLIMGVILSIAWYFIGVPYAIVLALLSGLLNIVPFAAGLGCVAAVILSVVAQLGGGEEFRIMIPIGAFIAFAVAQALDGWVIEPYVQGRATDLGPLTVLLSVMIGGALAGLLGMLLAIPFAACMKILAVEVILPRFRDWIAAWE